MTLAESQLIGKFVITFPEVAFPAGRTKYTLYIDTTGGASGYAWTNYTSAEMGLRSLGDDETKYDFDDREFFILLGEFNCEVYDYRNNLGRLLTHAGLVKTTTKIIFEYKENGEASFITDFVGYIDDQSIENPPHSKTVSFTFKPQSNILNESPLFIAGVWNNLLGSDYPASPDITQRAKPLNQFIIDIYGIINPDITVTFYSNWVFKPDVSIPANEVALGALTINYYNLIQELLASGGATTYMDLLKGLARTLGCYTGMINQNEGYFGLYLTYLHTTDEYYPVTEKQIKNNGYTKRSTERLIKYIELNRVNQIGWTPLIGGENTGLNDDKISLDVFKNCLGIDYSEGPDAYPAGFGYDFGNSTYVQRIESPGISTLDMDDFILAYWGDYYLRAENRRRDLIKFRGVDIPVTKKIGYDGIVYQWLDLKKNYTKNETTVQAAIPVGTYVPDVPTPPAVTSEPLVTSPGGEEFIFQDGSTVGT